MQPVRVELESGGILHSVLALLSPFESANPSDQELLRQEVAGFLIVYVQTLPSFSPSDSKLTTRSVQHRRRYAAAEDHSSLTESGLIGWKGRVDWKFGMARPIELQ